MRRPELRLEVGEERQHRGLDLGLVLAPVRFEVSLVVIGSKAEKKPFEVALPAGELASHAGRLAPRTHFALIRKRPRLIPSGNERLELGQAARSVPGRAVGDRFLLGREPGRGPGAAHRRGRAARARPARGRDPDHRATTIQQSEAVAERLPGYLDQLNGYQPLAGIDLAGSLRGIAQSTLSSAVTVAEAVAGGVIDTMLVLVLGFWFIVDGGRMVAVALRLVPEKQRDKARFVQDTVSQVVGMYIRGQLVMASIIGLSAGVGSWLLGVRYPVLIGILAFLFELIPMVGPILASLPAVVISLTQPFPLVVYVIIFFVVMQVVENNVLAPRITGGAVGLHPVAAMLAIVIGAELGGVVGALFAVPFAGVASVLIAAVWKGWRGEPVIFERAGMRFKLPKKRAPA